MAARRRISRAQKVVDMAFRVVRTKRGIALFSLAIAQLLGCDEATSAPVDDPACWLIAVGNCPCRPNGMGNNNSKFVNAVKAAIRWLFDTSDVPINSVVIDFSNA